MGCVVNGPGEAREADIGIAGGRGKGILFRKGKVVKKVPPKEMVAALLAEVDRFEAAQNE
jgi:(E)-4-hydroxy-3-methylbut-2-enyl-diphosphate synthase